MRRATGERVGRASGLIYASPDGPVCQCCQPQVTFDPRGGLHVMWRNNVEGNRDLYLANSSDNGRTFSDAMQLGLDHWPLDACPMDGGGLAADADGKVLSVWRRQETVYRCRPGQPEESLGPGSQPWVAAGPGGFYAVWITGRPGNVLALLPDTESPLRLTARGSDPVVVGPVSGKGPIVAAWEEKRDGAGGIRAEVLKK